MTHKMRTIFLSVYAFIILQGLNAEFVVGQVRFFWGNDTKFPTKDFDDSQWAESTLPMEKSFQNRKSTLWLRFEVQYNLDQWTETPNLELGKFDFPFEVYIDGIMVLKDGEAEGNYHYSIGTWELVPLERPLENEIKRHVIAIKVNKDGGRVIFPIIRSISNSRTSFIRTVLDVLNASIYQVLALLVAFIGFFFMVQYFFYRKNRTNLFFALMNFCFALYFIRIGSALEILPYLQTFAISKAALFGALAFVYFFFCNFFDIWNNKYIKRVISLISSVIIMGILFIPETLDMVNNFFSLALIPASIVLIGVLIMTFIAVFKKKQDSIILMIGSLIAVGFGIHDIYHQINEIQPLFWLQGLGIFGLNLSMFIAVAVRSMVTLRELENSHVAIRENNETLRRIDREKDNILANTSHELRTPLSGILGLSHELMEDDSLGMWHKRSLRLIHHSASRLKNLINDILDHSKLKNQDIHIALQKVDLVSILENVVRMVMPLTLSKKITWKMTIEKGLPFVLGDPLRLEQILFNLTGNAAKFTPQGMIETFAYTEEGRVQVGVRDTGMGISAENLSKIFDSFNQVDTSTEREFGGTGLGLSITRDLVRLHQSELKVKSQINQGSVFWFSLTAMEDLELGYVAASGDGSTRSNGNNAEIEWIDVPLPSYSVQPLLVEESKNLSSSLDTITTPTILVVDDELINLEVVKGQFRKLAYDLVTLESGSKCLQHLDTYGRPDIILLDVMMPKMTGYDLLREIRKRWNCYELPVLFLTAKSQEQDLSEGFAAGANDYLPKPCTKTELVARVEHHISMSKHYRLVGLGRNE